MNTQTNEPSIYTQKGYANRIAYLRHLANEYEVDLGSVLSLAELLGPDEDFDGLVEELKDFSQFIL